jgi:predicted molibdopterin-dependent oxidoreductase YjgC
MCDEGRFTYHELRDRRLAGPTIDGLPARWDAALAKAASMVQAALARGRDSVGVVFSPHHTNEDNYTLAKVARDHWQLTRLYVGGRANVPGRADSILRDADVSANRAGVRAILGDAGATAEALEKDLLAGKLTTLLVLGHELPISEESLDRAENLEALIVIADREVGVAERAGVVLAAAAWAEVNGTVTNRQGRVQRMYPALEPNGQSLAAWEIAVKLARLCDVAIDWASPRAVFDAMIGAVPALAGAEWGRAARPVQLRFANSRG